MTLPPTKTNPFTRYTGDVDPEGCRMLIDARIWGESKVAEREASPMYQNSKFDARAPVLEAAATPVP